MMPPPQTLAGRPRDAGPGQTGSDTSPRLLPAILALIAVSLVFSLTVYVYVSIRRSCEKHKSRYEELRQSTDETISGLREKLHNVEFMNHQFICSNKELDEQNMFLRNKLLKMGVSPGEIPGVRSRPSSGFGLHQTSASIPVPHDDSEGLFAVGSDPSDDEEGSENESIVDEDGHGTEAGTLNPPPREHQQSPTAGPSHPTGHENLGLRGGSEASPRPRSLQDELAAAGENDSDDEYEEEEEEEEGEEKEEEERNEQHDRQQNDEEGEDKETVVQGLAEKGTDGANPHGNDTRLDKSPFEDPSSDAHSSSSYEPLKHQPENDDEDGQVNAGIRLSAIPKPSSGASK